MTHQDDIYEALTRDMTAREIATELHLNTTQVSKSLRTLEAYGLIERHGTRPYSRGWVQVWRRA